MLRRQNRDHARRRGRGNGSSHWFVNVAAAFVDDGILDTFFKHFSQNALAVVACVAALPSVRLLNLSGFDPSNSSMTLCH